MGGETTISLHSQTQALPPFGGGWAPLQVGFAHYVSSFPFSGTSEAAVPVDLGVVPLRNNSLKIHAMQFKGKCGLHALCYQHI